MPSEFGAEVRTRWRRAGLRPQPLTDFGYALERVESHVLHHDFLIACDVSSHLPRGA